MPVQQSQASEAAGGNSSRPLAVGNPQQLREETGRNDNDGDRIVDAHAITINVPFNGLTSCPTCLLGGQNVAFTKPTELNKHIGDKHHSIRPTWKCVCEETFPKVHAWSCHRPHCKGRIEPKEFQCDQCSQSFATQVGLSQHERHNHPKARNEKRRSEAKSQENAPRRKQGPPSVLSEEELRQLKRLARIHRGKRNINVLIAAELPNKTNEQVSDKRKQIDLDDTEAESEGSNSEGEEEAARMDGEEEDEEEDRTDGEEEDEGREEEKDPVAARVPSIVVTIDSSEDEDSFVDVVSEPHSPASEDEEGPVEANVSNANDVRENVSVARSEEDDSADDWKIPLCQAVQENVPEKWAQALQKIQVCAASTNDCAEELEIVYAEMTRLILATSTEQDEQGVARRNKGKKVRGGPCMRRPVTNERRGNRRSRAPNRAERRRGAYAKCQELFDNEPKKLADIVASNNLSLIEKHAPP